MFVLLMVLSGITINHADSLRLDQRLISQSWVLDWYGLDGPGAFQSFNAGEDWLSFAGSQIYFNGEPVTRLANGRGVVFNGKMIVAAGGNELLLLSENGELIERMSWDKPDPVDAIGLLPDNTVLIESARQWWRGDAHLLRWQLVDGTEVSPRWSVAEPAPYNIHQAVVSGYRSSGLSLERLLLDLHSGRIFGAAGVLIYDALALLVGFLAISGLILWSRSRKNGKRRLKK